MKGYLHLLRFELLRLRWPLLWIAGLMATELGIRAWLVFGPVGKDWPNPPVPLDWLTTLLGLSLVVTTLIIFLDETNSGTRSPMLTQAVPPYLLGGVRLTLLAGLIGAATATGALVRWMLDSSFGWEIDDAPPLPSEISGTATIAATAETLRLRLSQALLNENEYPVFWSLKVVNSQRKIRRLDSHDLNHNRLASLASDAHRACVEAPDDVERRARVDLNIVHELGTPVRGEATFCIYRLERIPVLLNAPSADVTYRIRGRNARIWISESYAKDTELQWSRAGFFLWGDRQWRRDLERPGPILIRVTEPGAGPRLIALGGDGDRFHESGFPYLRYWLRDETSDATLEFYEERFVRIIRVNLVPEALATP